MNLTRTFLVAVVLMATCTAALDGVAAEGKVRSIADFFGTYMGHKSEVIGEGVPNQHLQVTIRRHQKEGFTIDWSTTVAMSDGTARIKKHSIDFHPVRRQPGLFASGMRKDVFGHMVPLDPLSGDPYVWASLHDDTLTVSALYIADDGGYEIHTYKRTLADSGMTLRFERIRNGARITLLNAELRKVAE